MSGAPPSPLWRVVRTNPPTEADFLSNEARGLPLRRNAPPELWSGLSVFDRPAIAAEMARRFRLGDFLATIALEAGAPIRWEKTRGEGHYTLWGTPDDLLARVVAIEPVAAAGEREGR